MPGLSERGAFSASYTAKASTFAQAFGSAPTERTVYEEFSTQNVIFVFISDIGE